MLDGKGKMTATGQLGDVMQESAQGGAHLHPFALASSWTGEGLLQERRHSRSRAGGSDSKGRALCGHHTGYGACECPDEDQGTPRCCHDWRDHAAWKGASDRWTQRRSFLRHTVQGSSRRSCPEDNRKDLADLPELLTSTMKLHFVEESGSGAEAGAGREASRSSRRRHLTLWCHRAQSRYRSQ